MCVWVVRVWKKETYSERMADYDLRHNTRGIYERMVGMEQFKLVVGGSSW